jgi:hypothetical protein
LLVARVTDAADNAEEIQANDGFVMAKFLENASKEVWTSEGEGNRWGEAE